MLHIFHKHTYKVFSHKHAIIKTIQMSTQTPHYSLSPHEDAVHIIPANSDQLPHNQFTAPLYTSTVRAGFPSPADDHIESHLNINTYLIKNPDATFFVRVSGTSMINAGIHENDILVVDKSIPPHNNNIIVVAIDGELTVKRLRKTEQETLLVPENPKFKPILVNAESNVVVWGVAIGLIRSI